MCCAQQNRPEFKQTLMVTCSVRQLGYHIHLYFTKELPVARKHCFIHGWCTNISPVLNCMNYFILILLFLFNPFRTKFENYSLSQQLSSEHPGRGIHKGESCRPAIKARYSMLGFIGKGFSWKIQIWHHHSDSLVPQYLGAGSERDKWLHNKGVDQAVMLHQHCAE